MVLGKWRAEWRWTTHDRRTRFSIYTSYKIIKKPLLRVEGKSIFLFSKYIYIYTFFSPNTFSQHISPERYTRTLYLQATTLSFVNSTVRTYDTQSSKSRARVFNIFRSKWSSGHVHGDNRKVNVHHKPVSNFNAFRTQWSVVVSDISYVVRLYYIMAVYGCTILLWYKYLYSISPKDLHIDVYADKK